MWQFGNICRIRVQVLDQVTVHNLLHTVCNWINYDSLQHCNPEISYQFPMQFPSSHPIASAVLLGFLELQTLLSSTYILLSAK